MLRRVPLSFFCVGRGGGEAARARAIAPKEGTLTSSGRSFFWPALAYFLDGVWAGVPNKYYGILLAWRAARRRLDYSAHGSEGRALSDSVFSHRALCDQMP